MAESIINRHFPSQVGSDLEKMSFDYGEKVAKAIQQEWFTNHLAILVDIIITFLSFIN